MTISDLEAKNRMTDDDIRLRFTKLPYGCIVLNNKDDIIISSSS
ncbi:MAG: hypothetical protein Gaeavirus14_15 [Gaeavirus sp.]|uniref:Uncharacterized protein n=1 Tax=Gaeavirus sp. TaxID=2487767 RepID=A0A3G4ZZ28_9VIRU|nr:MAG: hypothetical protein Gaeavirus14_15 [Gaeavirus sp.]